MSLIGTGTSLRKKAQEGLTAVANLEAQQNAQEDALKMQAKAAETQMYGLGAGIGGAYGVNKAIAASKAAEAAAGSAASGTGAGSAGGFFSPTGGGAALSQSANAGAAVTTGTTTAGGGAVGGGAAGGGAAGASSGALGTLGTIAAPIAIGLGAAFLLNKLFG